MVSTDIKMRRWANPIDISSFVNSKDSDETFQGRPVGPVVCFICKVYLPRVPNNRKKEIILKHKNSARHAQSIKLVKLNSICVDNSSSDVQLVCRLCNRNLDFGENVTDHILDLTHRSWMETLREASTSSTLLVNANIVSTEKFMSCESDFAFCNACKMEVECTTPGIIAHTTEESHRKLFLDALLPYSGIFPLENNTVMWCKVCDLRMSNHFEEVLVHLTGNQAHGQWFHDIDTTRKQDISSMKFLTDVNEMRVMCTRCDIRLKIDYRSIISHVHSETHRLRHKNESFQPVKSLSEQGFWPEWCHWNFFIVVPRELIDHDWMDNGEVDDEID